MGSGPLSLSWDSPSKDLPHRDQLQRWHQRLRKGVAMADCIAFAAAAPHCVSV